MSAARTIAFRELASYFRTPAGWIIIALYLFLVGVCFAMWTLVPGRPASMRDLFTISGWIFLPVAPAISMRLLADEFKHATYETLITSPVGAVPLVMGKFLGGAAFLLLLVAPTAAHVAVLSMHSEPRPDLGPILSGYLCLALLGTLYLCIGVAASTLTSNSTLAFMVTFFAILFLLFAERVAGVENLPGWARTALLAVAPGPRVVDFAKGVIGLSDVAYFVTGSGLFLLLAIAVMELRRWR